MFMSLRRTGFYCGSMQPDESTPPTLNAEAFFEMVESLLTPPMAGLGYHRIGGYVNDQPSSRSVLTAPVGGPARTDTEGEVAFPWFEFGYEAGSDDVQRLVGPGDPEREGEWWANYEPATGRLELRDWEPVAREQVDWDIRGDDGPCSESEVRRRLTKVGEAVLAFVASQRRLPHHVLTCRDPRAVMPMSG
jgi:hypothetical protein